MSTNLDRHKADLEKLLSRAERLRFGMERGCDPKRFDESLLEQCKSKEDFTKIVTGLPNFKIEYQSWYSEAKAVVRQLLPDRLDDFARLFERPKTARKEVTSENYKIEDYLHGISVSRGDRILVAMDAAIPLFQQQIAILTAVRARFESSLFDIRQLVQADVFDSELDAARELLKHKFGRAAGAMAGVVLEKHLAQLLTNHNVILNKKNPTISDLNDKLKLEGIIEIPQWRRIQHLGDLRNLCDHNKSLEPTVEQITDLLDGVVAVTKTLF